MTEKAKRWPSKRHPEGFCGGIFPHVYAPPDALEEPGICIFCGTPEAVGVAAGDHGRVGGVVVVRAPSER
jgi:hypothetical protein